MTKTKLALLAVLALAAMSACTPDRTDPLARPGIAVFDPETGRLVRAVGPAHVRDPETGRIMFIPKGRQWP